MQQYTLSGLLREAKRDFAKKYAKFLILEVEGAGGPHPELIINTKENIESKLEYLKKAYNEDLTLKAAPHIKITYYEFIEYLEYY
jgi:hypothetical protein